MREIIAVCQSSGASRDKAASILDSYFARIGSRTWRGKASNACLDRVSRELRSVAKRNMAIMIQEVRSAHASKRPIITIGNKSAFSDDGNVPVFSHPAQYRKSTSMSEHSQYVAIVKIAALFHDLGKAGNIFQNKIKGKNKKAGDAIRHELISAAVFDMAYGKMDDAEFIEAMKSYNPSTIDNAWEKSKRFLIRLRKAETNLEFKFLDNPNSLVYYVGVLILTHHKLPSGDQDMLMTSLNHVRISDDPKDQLTEEHVSIAPGIPFYHEPWFSTHIRRDAQRLVADTPPYSIDMALRLSLVFADHQGSSEKKITDEIPDHLANTDTIDDVSYPADSLSTHVKRVYSYIRSSTEMMFKYSMSFPSLSKTQLPVDILHPTPGSGNFAWQSVAAEAAKDVCSQNEGGFFACILAGTGSGKTRGAPTIMASAAINDVVEERRGFRVTVGLGLRNLAHQSAKEYVDDLKFNASDVSVMIGTRPIIFDEDEEKNEDDNGSENLSKLPDWLLIARAEGGIPPDGAEGEDEWVKTLSLDTSRSIPAFAQLITEKDTNQKTNLLISSPIIVGTIDHVINSAAGIKTSHKFAALRIMTSDLILDEIDQYSPEDLAVISRLVYQSGVAGRRVMIMSATAEIDIATNLFKAYKTGWDEYARFSGVSNNVNILCSGSDANSVAVNYQNETFNDMYVKTSNHIVKQLKETKGGRKSRILEALESKEDILEQIDRKCSDFHDMHNFTIQNKKISFGIVKLTRIRDVVHCAENLRAGKIDDNRHRFIICLHSNFPALTRQYIENELRKVLKRSSHSNAWVQNVERFLRNNDAFARSGSAENLEIVLVCSPVIETGNDLDFDYGIFESVFSRSFIQGPGRVYRHRNIPDKECVAFIGNSMIAIDNGKLMRPGIESDIHKSVNVAKGVLVDRTTLGILSMRELELVNSSLVLDDADPYALMQEERRVRADMFKSSDKYINDINVRINTRFNYERKFRRTTVPDLILSRYGDSFENADWFVDKTPWIKNSRRKCRSNEIMFVDDPSFSLIQRLESKSYNAFLSNKEFEFKHLRMMDLVVPDYTYRKGDEISFTYSEFSGLTPGKR